MKPTVCEITKQQRDNPNPNVMKKKWQIIQVISRFQLCFSMNYTLLNLTLQ